ncbi:MAG: 3-ketoacyl-ACP reductase, partial [Mesorhizobium sp.]|nr:3-ketoacyl-ACP reductase [Mesorhizobium sp.]
MKTLSGKTALLTGALGTLGRAQAVALAKAGANLLLLDRPGAEGGEAFAAGIAGAQKTACVYVG